MALLHNTYPTFIKWVYDLRGYTHVPIKLLILCFQVSQQYFYSAINMFSDAKYFFTMISVITKINALKKLIRCTCIIKNNAIYQTAY